MNFTLRFKADSLCEHCSQGTVVKQDGQIVALQCHYMRYGAPSQPVHECSSYEFAYASAPFPMERRAWILETKGNKPIGFRSPLDRMNRQEGGPDGL